jgi:hypothetical protein
MPNPLNEKESRIKTTEGTEFWYENLRRPVALFLSWDFIGAYAMPHILKNALNVSRAI